MIKVFLVSLLIFVIDDAQCTKRALVQFTDNVGPDQRVHLYSVICAFSVRRNILPYPVIL